MDSGPQLEVRAVIGSLNDIPNSPTLTARQERLLQGLMREIVRMTAQKQPLEVGVPLFPFSHQSLFRKDEPPRPPSVDSAAPLPTSPPYEVQSLPNQGPSSTHSASPMMSGASWTGRNQ